MTGMGGPEPDTSRGRAKLKAEAIPPGPLTAHGEVAEEGASLVGTFFLPLHQPSEVKYHVGRRTITLWSRKQGHEFQTILVLPRWVNPATFLLRHQNGLFEFVLDPTTERDADTGAR